MRNLAVVTESIFFRDLAYVLMAAVAGGAVARLARQPLILGYVLGGILISPLTPGPAVSDLQAFELFAEIGVILLMFSIGIEFSLRDLLRVKWVALLGGPLGIVLSVAMGLGAAALLGWPLAPGRHRGHRHLGGQHHGARTTADGPGRAPLATRPHHDRHHPGRGPRGRDPDRAHPGARQRSSRAGCSRCADGLGKSLLVLIPFGYVAAKVIPPLMTRVARMHSDEMFLLVALAIGLGTAALTQAVGLSLALGAFLAGLIINGSDYAHETLARLLPLRDVFVALFFVTIGALIDPAAILANLPLLGTMVAMIVVGKLVLRTVVVWLFRRVLLDGAAGRQSGSRRSASSPSSWSRSRATSGHVGPESTTPPSPPRCSPS